MASFLQADFWLSQGDEIKVTVEAMNQIDYSLPSEVSGAALVQVRPHVPLNAPKRGQNTNESQVEVEFDLVSNDGGAAIVTY